MNLLLFGTGQYYEQYKRYFGGQNVVALVDNDSRKIGTEKDGILIVSPPVGLRMAYDGIFILSSSYRAILDQLLSLGVNRDKIFTIYDIGRICGLSNERTPLKTFCKEITRCSCSSIERKKIAILTMGLGINGGDFVVLMLARTLYSSYDVHIITRRDGPLRDQFLELGIPVIIDEDLQVETIDEIRGKERYDLFFVNGASFLTLFQQNKEINHRIIWWIHSSGDMNEELPLYRMNDILQGTISVYGVSARAVESFRKVVPSWKIQKFCYGIKDVAKQVCVEKEVGGKIIIAMVGSFQPRKAQDVFLAAIERLSEENRRRCEFWLIGPMNQRNFSEKIRNYAERIDEVKILGSFENDALQKIYGQISVLVSASLEDTMPIVCAEAMMHWHPCIVTDHVGTAEYIIPEENGLICRAGDANDLALKIEWMIDHAERIPAMGKAARLVYEKEFSQKRFARELLGIVENKLQVEGC